MVVVNCLIFTASWQ